MSEQDAAILGSVNFACDYCGGRFDFAPGLMGAGLGVQITVQRENDVCVRHTARVVDTTAKAPADTNPAAPVKPRTQQGGSEGDE